MNIIKNKKFAITAVIIITLIIATAIAIFSHTNNSLSKTQVAALRSEYPICNNFPPFIARRNVSLEECINMSDTFVYAEVVGDINRYKVDATFDSEEMEEKSKAYGADDTYEFFEYSLIIIDDAENVFKKGDKITIASNSDFEDYYPKLKEGMKVVVPVKSDINKKDRNYYTVEGMFYITDKGYAISAFEEDIKTAKSGIKVDALLKELKK